MRTLPVSGYYDLHEEGQQKLSIQRSLGLNENDSATGNLRQMHGRWFPLFYIFLRRVLCLPWILLVDSTEMTQASFKDNHKCAINANRFEPMPCASSLASELFPCLAFQSIRLRMGTIESIMRFFCTVQEFKAKITSFAWMNKGDFFSMEKRNGMIF